MHFSGVCLECNFINPLPSLILIDIEVSPNDVHICASCFSRLCFGATRGLWESAFDYKYSENTKMLLLQLRCSLCLCNWLWWPRRAQRKSLSCCSLCYLLGSVHSRSIGTCLKNMDINYSVLGKLRLLFGYERLHLLLQLGSILFFVLSSICFDTVFTFSKKWARVIFSAISCSPSPRRSI